MLWLLLWGGMEAKAALPPEELALAKQMATNRTGVRFIPERWTIPEATLAAVRSVQNASIGRRMMRDERIQNLLCVRQPSKTSKCPCTQQHGISMAGIARQHLSSAGDVRTSI